MMQIGLLAVALAFSQAQPVEEPVRFRVAASGDFLIHTPVAARAGQLGGGSRYDFAPLFDPVKRHIEGADLALCHVETPLVPGPVQGYPSLSHTAGACGLDPQGRLGRLQHRVQPLARRGRVRHRHHAGRPGPGRHRAPRDGTLARRSAGASRHSASRALKVAFLSYTAISNGQAVPHPWNLNWASPGPILADARRAKRSGADAVIVNLHWGNEYQHALSPSQLSLARPSHESARRDGDRRPARARRAADPPGQRQAGGLRRGQPRVQSDRRLLPGRLPGRADRPDRLRGDAGRAGEGEAHRLRAHLRSPSRLHRGTRRAGLGVMEPHRQRGGAPARHRPLR